MVVKNSPKKGHVETIIIEKFSHDGRGIARISGKTTFIEGALPGEVVSFKYTRIKKDFDEGTVVDVISPSVHRTQARCPHYVDCGGCSLQHLDEQSQLGVKQDLLLDVLRRVGHIEPEALLPPLSAVAWEYRNKARLSVRFIEKKEKTLIGFRERHNPRYIADIDSCAILHPKVSHALPALGQVINALDKREAIAQIEVAAGDEAIALIIRNLMPLTPKDEQILKNFGKQTEFILFLQPGGIETITKLYPEGGDDLLHYSLPERGVRYYFHPADFTQINPAINRLMVTKAMDLLDLQPDDVVLDLFCGLGNFSLAMAKKCSKVIGIEGSNLMAERADYNAKQNQIPNANFFCADLSKPDSLFPYLKQPITKVLLDPPRTGALEIIQQISKLKSRSIIYISCNPATFARDAGVLVNQEGYRLKAVGVMDMFPHTAHVESIALFEKG